MSAERNYIKKMQYREKTEAQRERRRREFLENIEIVYVAAERFDYFWTPRELQHFFRLWRSEEIIEMSSQERLIILSEKLKRSQYDIAILIMDLGASNLI